MSLERADDGLDAAQGRDLHLVHGIVSCQVTQIRAAFPLHARVGRVGLKLAEDVVDQRVITK